MTAVHTYPYEYDTDLHIMIFIVHATFHNTYFLYAVFYSSMVDTLILDHIWILYSILHSVLVYCTIVWKASLTRSFHIFLLLDLCALLILMTPDSELVFLQLLLLTSSFFINATMSFVMYYKNKQFLM